jgi:hypothetical protein
MSSRSWLALLAVVVWVLSGAITVWLVRRTVRVVRRTRVEQRRMAAEVSGLAGAAKERPDPESQVEVFIYALETVPFGPPKLGEWCEHCALPSAFRQSLVGLHADRVVARTDVVACSDCGAWHNETPAESLDNRSVE